LEQIEPRKIQSGRRTSAFVRIGDGLYASWDGYQIMLRAPDTMSGDRVVYLDSHVQVALVKFIERIAAAG
jgi:hypothetical protein